MLVLFISDLRGVTGAQGIQGQTGIKGTTGIQGPTGQNATNGLIPNSRVDEDYTLLKMFEGWMEYISSGSDGSVSQSHRAYYKRMRYPDTYKCNTMYINKFEKNYKRSLRYQFVNVFPKSMGAIPVSYKSADLLKVTVSFNFDRYIING